MIRLVGRQVQPAYLPRWPVSHEAKSAHCRSQRIVNAAVAAFPSRKHAPVSKSNDKFPRNLPFLVLRVHCDTDEGKVQGHVANMLGVTLAGTAQKVRHVEAKWNLACSHVVGLPNSGNKRSPQNEPGATSDHALVSVRRAVKARTPPAKPVYRLSVEFMSCQFTQRNQG